MKTAIIKSTMALAMALSLMAIPSTSTAKTFAPEAETNLYCIVVNGRTYCFGGFGTKCSPRRPCR